MNLVMNSQYYMKGDPVYPPLTTKVLDLVITRCSISKGVSMENLIHPIYSMRYSWVY